MAALQAQDEAFCVGCVRVAEVGGSGEIDEPSLRAKWRCDKGMTVCFCLSSGLVFESSFTACAGAIIHGYFRYGALLGQRSPSVTVHSRRRPGAGRARPE